MRCLACCLGGGGLGNSGRVKTSCRFVFCRSLRVIIPLLFFGSLQICLVCFVQYFYWTRFAACVRIRILKKGDSSSDSVVKELRPVGEYMPLFCPDLPCIRLYCLSYFFFPDLVKVRYSLYIPRCAAENRIVFASVLRRVCVALRPWFLFWFCPCFVRGFCSGFAYGLLAAESDRQYVKPNKMISPRLTQLKSRPRLLFVCCLFVVYFHRKQQNNNKENQKSSRKNRIKPE